MIRLMWGRQSKKTTQRLKQEGKPANAKILSISRGFGVTHGNEIFVENTQIDCSVRLLVQPEAEPEFEVKTRLRFPQLSVPQQGSTIAVIYDPSDPKKMILQDGAEQLQNMFGANSPVSGLIGMALSGASEQDLIDKATQEFASSDSATVISGGQIVSGAPGSDPAESLKELSRLHQEGSLTDEEFAAAKQKLLGL